LLIDAHCTIGYACFATTRRQRAVFMELAQAKKEREKER
jgi:hypothetical protein